MRRVAIALVAAAALSLAACDPPAVEGGERVAVQPEPRTEQHSSGGLCMPCVGPHLSLTGGGIKFFSMGPGIGF